MLCKFVMCLRVWWMELLSSACAAVLVMMCNIWLSPVSHNRPANIKGACEAQYTVPNHLHFYALDLLQAAHTSITLQKDRMVGKEGVHAERLSQSSLHVCLSLEITCAVVRFVFGVAVAHSSYSP